MILIGAFVVLAVIGFAISFSSLCQDHTARHHYEEVAFVVAMFCFLVVTALVAGAYVRQREQQKTVELHGNLAQLLKLIDAREDPTLSARARGTLAPMIGKVNEAVADAKASNDGLLDIWYSDVLAASKPLR